MDLIDVRAANGPFGFGGKVGEVVEQKIREDHGYFPTKALEPT